MKNYLKSWMTIKIGYKENIFKEIKIDSVFGEFDVIEKVIYFNFNVIFTIFINIKVFLLKGIIDPIPQFPLKSLNTSTLTVSPHTNSPATGTIPTPMNFLNLFNFLKLLLNLVRYLGPDKYSLVCNLTQDLLDGRVDPETFITLNLAELRRIKY